MKKFLLTLAAFGLVAASAFADTAYFYATAAAPEGATSANSTQLTGTVADQTFSTDKVSIKFVKHSTSSSNVNTNLVRWYKEDQIEITVNNGANIEFTGIKMTCGSATYANAVKVSTPSGITPTVTGSEASAQFSEPVSEVTLSNSAQVRFSVLEIQYEAKSNLPSPELSFSSETEEVNLGEEFTAPVLNNPHGVAPIIWTSSNENVATVEDGNVTILSAGTTEIKAAFEGNDTYNTGFAKYTLTVVDPNALEATFDFVNETFGLERGSSTYIAEGTTIANGKAILTFHNEGNNRSRLWNGGLRVYNQGKITVSLEQGYKISEITVDPATNLNCTLKSDGTYNIERTSTSGNTEITTINVKYSVAPEYAIAILEVPNEDGGAISIVRQNELNGYDIYAGEESFGSFRMLYDDPLLNPFELDFYTLTADDENLTWESINGSSQYEFFGEVGIYPFTVMFKPTLIGHQNLYRFSTLYDNRIIIHPDVEHHFSFTDLEWKEASVEMMVDGEKMHRLHHPNFEGKNPNGDYTYYYMVNTHAKNQIRREAEAGTEDEWNEYDHETGIILPQGTHTVIFNAAKNGVMAPTPKFVEINTDNLRTGVTAIEAENGKAAYFDMMGRRITEPAEGIFIKVQNGKASKVIK